jgi:hypothetical protein
MTPLIAATNERAVVIPAAGVSLPGVVAWPVHPSGIVLFAHESGSSRGCLRNRHVTSQLRAAGLATLELDLLTETEASDLSNRFDVETLARRLIAGVHWVGRQPEVADCRSACSARASAPRPRCSRGDGARIGGCGGLARRLPGSRRQRSAENQGADAASRRKPGFPGARAAFTGAGPTDLRETAGGDSRIEFRQAGCAGEGLGMGRRVVRVSPRDQTGVALVPPTPRESSRLQLAMH